MVEHLREARDAVLYAGNRLGRRLAIAGGIMAELLAVNAGNSLQTC